MAAILAAVEASKAVSNPFTPTGEFPREEVLTKHIAAPSKLEVALQWFSDHPEDKKRSARDLAEHVQPLGIRISHTYWNDAKKRRKGK